jgi:hypothetical protein
MTPEHDKDLYEKYPKIFKDRGASIQESAMSWGFECGDGWYDLINDLCNKIQTYLDANPEVEQVVAAQVKEKFGSLRFYIDGGDTHIVKMIDEAENKSEKTCEVCGKEGRINRVKGWLSCRCPEHESK